MAYVGHKTLVELQHQVRTAIYGEALEATTLRLYLAELRCRPANKKTIMPAEAEAICERVKAALPAAFYGAVDAAGVAAGCQFERDITKVFYDPLLYFSKKRATFSDSPVTYTLTMIGRWVNAYPAPHGSSVQWSYDFPKRELSPAGGKPYDAVPGMEARLEVASSSLLALAEKWNELPQLLQEREELMNKLVELDTKAVRGGNGIRLYPLTNVFSEYRVTHS